MLGYRAYMWLRRLAEQHDMLYVAYIHALAPFRPRLRRRLVTKNSDLVLEGFPRSANTYFFWYFDTAQRREWKVAHHLHSPYQIRAAVKHRIPCVFLIRNPLDCVASAVLRDARLSVGAALRSYLTLYSTAVEHANHLLLVPQKMAIKNPHEVIGAINARYGCAFDILPKERLGEVYERINARHLSDWKLSEPDPARLALPSAQKEAAKEPIAEQIRTQQASLLKQCQEKFELLEALAWQAQPNWKLSEEGQPASAATSAPAASGFG